MQASFSVYLCVHVEAKVSIGIFLNCFSTEPLTSQMGYGSCLVSPRGLSTCLHLLSTGTTNVRHACLYFKTNKQNMNSEDQMQI